MRPTWLILPPLILLAGCAAISSEHLHDAVNFQSDHVAMAVRAQYRTVAVLPFFNETQYANAARYARRAFYGALASYKNYSLQPIAETDARIKDLPRKTLDPAEYHELARVLGTDLLVFGWVKRQLHSYGVFYGRNAVTVRIAFVDARTGQIVWDATDSRSRLLIGISFLSILNNEYRWAREIVNRYDELFRDMMTAIPDVATIPQTQRARLF
ncbi:MAG: hypothetical protein N2595_08415 [bacterium]|nr:hypothetical protein [bacterium]